MPRRAPPTHGRWAPRAILTMAVLTMAALTMAVLTMAVLTMAVLTMAVLTMAALTMAVLAMADPRQDSALAFSIVYIYLLWQDSALAFSNTELLGIRSVAGEPRLFNLLVNSLSPAIFGHEIVKAPPPYACYNTDYTDYTCHTLTIHLPYPYHTLTIPKAGLLL